MRRASSFHSRQLFMELKLTSLIDVVFLLLIFFVWTASFRSAEYVLPSHISESKTTGTVGNSAQPPSPAADFPDIVVRIGWANNEPTWRVNEETVGALRDVQNKLSRVFTINREAPIIIHPEREVPLGHVIDLYDLARRIGFGKVQFAVAREA